MPKAKKGEKKGNGKGKGKRDKNAVGPDSITVRLFNAYQLSCTNSNSAMAPNIRKALKKGIEDEKIISEFILEPVKVEKDGDLPVLFEPLIATLRQIRYTYIRDIYVWDYPISYDDICSFTSFLQKPFYKLRLIEFLDCLLDPLCIRRFARIFPFCDQLTIVKLDYNEFGDEGVKYLCDGLKANVTLLSLSLCYCDLGVASGKYLGHIVSTTALRELYLDGNNLQCEGTMELIKLCVDQAELEAFERAKEEQKKAEEEALKTTGENRRSPGLNQESAEEKDDKSPPGSAKKKKKKKGKKKKKPPAPPPVGPWIYKLHLADNGIDGLGESGSFAPIICMRLFKKIITNSKCLEELDLEDNLIGEVGGREILEGLTARKEQKMGGVKVRTTHRMTADTFNSIIKLGSGLKKKKGKRKKKKKK